MSAAYVVFAATRQPNFVSDYDQLWFAGRVLLRGGDPYAELGPGKAFDLPFPLYYPLTAVVVGLPLAKFDVIVARTLWVAVPAAVLTFLVTRSSYARLPMFMSGAFLSCALNAQWTPLLLCALYLPPIAGVVVGKPNIGVLAIAGASSRRAIAYAVVGGLVVLAISLAVAPRWPTAWLTTVASASHFKPYLLHPIGWLLLLSVRRWRIPSARVLLALTIVPHTAAPYEGLWAFTATNTFRQALVFAFLTHGAMFAVAPLSARMSFDRYVDASSWTMLVLVYLPWLWLILRRPNRESSDSN